jgi:CRP/FNR family transcriptional regulator, cyclic AMP receptor protein
MPSRPTAATKAATLSAIRDQPKFAKLFTDHLLSRNSRFRKMWSINSLIRARSDLLACYCFWLTMGKEGNPPIVQVVLSQETLAEMIGTTRSGLSFFMNKFRKLGFIDYNGKIDVHQSLLDSILHDKPEIRED